jgi:predicted hydrocarbon binding protein
MKTFEVEYECPNCSNKWKEQYEKGDVIHEGGCYSNTRLQAHDCTLQISCTKCHDIECPVCGFGRGFQEAIRVKSRKPILTSNKQAGQEKAGETK